MGVALLLFYAWWLRPQLSGYLGHQVSVNLAQPSALPGEVQQGIDQARQNLPAVIAALPEGEIRINEQQANAFLQSNQSALDPVEPLAVQFVPGQVQADFALYGTQGRLSAGVAVQDGRVVVQNPRLDGPLGHLLAIEDVVRPIEAELNQQLRAQNQQVRAARIEQGQVIIVVERGS
jgi:hypothetical protein